MRNKTVIIDNYDSFTYNLVHAIEHQVEECRVMRNDEIDWEELHRCDIIVLSPGPELPATAGEMPRVIETFMYQKPVLGVCLGMQGIVTALPGGELLNLKGVQHGRSVTVEHLNADLFAGVPPLFNAGLYHSWGVRCDQIPEGLEVLARSGELAMAVQLRGYPVYGVQFHPESVMTEYGGRLLSNWLRLSAREIEKQHQSIPVGSKKNG